MTYKAELDTLRDQAETFRHEWAQEIEDKRAQAAAHGEDVRKIQVRMVKVVGALRKIYEGQNCVCKLNPYVGGPVPCETCQLGALLAETDGRCPCSFPHPAHDSCKGIAAFPPSGTP